MAFFNGYLALGTGAGGSFVEVAAAGYARQPVTLSQTRDVSVAILQPVTFGAFTAAPGAIYQIGVFDQITGGNLTLWTTRALGSPAIGATLTVAANTVRLTIPAVEAGATNVFSAGAPLGTSQGAAVFAGVGVTIGNGALAVGNTAPAPITPVSVAGVTLPLITSGGTVITADQVAVSTFTGKTAPLINPGDLWPTAHLGRFRTACAAASAKVAFVGDSINSLTPNNLATITCTQMLKRRYLRARNPGVALSFGDFTIGGQGFPQFSGGTPPSQFPAWFTNQSATWLSYVATFAPDLLMIALGNNDPIVTVGYTDDLAAEIKAGLTLINGFSTKPSIIFETPRAPAQLVATGTQAGSTWQLSMLLVAGFIRTMCRTNGAIFGISGLPNLGLIDLSARFMQVARGIDPTRTIMTQIIGGSGAGSSAPITGLSCASYHSNFPGDGTVGYQLPTASGGDFDLQFSVVSGATGTFQSAGFYPVINRGYAGDLLTISITGGRVYIEVFAGDVNAGNIQMNAALPAYTGDPTFEVGCKQEQITVSMNGTLLFELSVPRHCGGPITPNVAWAGTIPSGQAFSVLAYAAGSPMPVQASIADPALFGPYTGNVNTAVGPSGGNGWNHPSELQTSVIDEDVYAAANLTGL